MFLSFIIFENIIEQSMGNALTYSSDQIDQTQNTTQLKITLDLNKPVKDQLKQLLFWSLEEIRNIYAPFRKRKSSPILTRSQFLRFVRLSRISAFHIYDELCKSDLINAFEVMSILVLTSFTTQAYKVQFMFNVFDLLSMKSLRFTDLILMFKSVVRGFAFLTNQPLPDINMLQKYAHTIFSQADLNNDQNLELSQVLSWVENYKEAGDLWKRFQPKVYGKEEYHIFNGFTPYRQEEIQILLTRIKKVHTKEKLENQDYMLLKIPNQKLPKTSSAYKQNLFLLTSPQYEIQKKNSLNPSSRSKYKSNAVLQNKSSSMLLHDKSNSVKFPSCLSPTSNTNKDSYFLSCRSKKNRFNNIIIIKGRTITKREIFDLRDYFDRLSSDFIQSFSQEKYNHMKSVAASLYNFLDHDQNGRVSFKELLLKIYPDLAPQHISIIDIWCEEYNINFNVKNKVKINKTQQQTKKRVLPKACLVRFKEMFTFYDRTKKGYIDLQDMRKVLSQVCSDKQIFDLFEDSDKDKDNKLTMQQFANLILPSDIQIQGLQ